ncbi:tetratricopeptide repeat protein [Flavobacterium sp. N1719]|uniref:tetratricopeptide repeat protein n=1 Tax=Flavobacterium sp. N1719 TaxID=2885633 RepID=UPI002221B26D|nr:tetratricopeptide repeat protein [Flavobacterium sp. N1719]
MNRSLILILLFIYLPHYAQDHTKKGYIYMEKSQRKLAQGKLAQARDYLESARKVDFHGGNPEATAHSRMNLIEAQILLQEKRYDDALRVLDTTHGASFGVNCLERDSLKIVTLIKKHGLQKVNTAFTKAIVQLNPDKAQFDATYCVSLNDLGYTFCFYAPIVLTEEELKSYPLAALAKECSFYQLLF